MGGFNVRNGLQGAIEGFVSGLPEGAAFVRNLRAAAAQQDELAERKRQFDIEQGMRQRQQDRESQQRGFENQVQLSDRGAQPVGGDDTYSMPLGNNPNGLPLGNASVGVEPSDNVVTPPGSTQKYRIPSRQEAADADLFNLTLPGPLAEILGLPHGSTVRVKHAPTADDYARMGDVVNQKQNADTKQNAPPKAEKTEPMIDLTPAEKKQFGVSKDQIPQSEYKIRSENYERVNGRPKSGNGSEKESAVQGRFDQRELDSAWKTHESLQHKEKAAWLKSDAYKDALTTIDKDGKKAWIENGDDVSDPEKDGKTYPMSDGLRKMFLKKSDDAYQQAMQYQEQARSIRRNFKLGEFAQQPGGKTGASNPAGQPGGQQTGAPGGGRGGSPSGRGNTQSGGSTAPKSATTDQIRAYAQKKGVSVSQAVKEFQSAGYKVQ